MGTSFISRKANTHHRMQETIVPAGYSQVEAVEDDQGVHAPAPPASPRAVQSGRHQFEEYSHRMNGMQCS